MPVRAKEVVISVGNQESKAPVQSSPSEEHWMDDLDWCVRDRNSVSALFSRKIGGILFNLVRAGSTDRMSCGTIRTEEMRRIILLGPSGRALKHIKPSGAALPRSHPCARDSGITMGVSLNIPEVIQLSRTIVVENVWDV